MCHSIEPYAHGVTEADNQSIILWYVVLEMVHWRQQNTLQIMKYSNPYPDKQSGQQSVIAVGIHESG